MVQTTPLTPTEIADMLRAASAMLQAELNALPERLLGWHSKPEEWCIKQVLGHLIQTEQTGFAGRIRLLIADEDPRLDALDQDEEALKRNDCARDAAELLQEFVSLRSKSCTTITYDPDTGNIYHQGFVYKPKANAERNPSSLKLDNPPAHILPAANRWAPGGAVPPFVVEGGIHADGEDV